MSEDATPIETTTPRENPPDAAELGRRLEAALERIETSQMDETQRRVHDLTRRLDTLAQERERLLASAREWEGRYRDTLTRQLLTEAAVAGGAYRPEQVVSLLSRSVEWDEQGREPALVLPDSEGRPVRYDRRHFAEAVRAYLAENPNLARGEGRGGAGSRGSTATPPRRAGAVTLSELRVMRAQLEEEARRRR